MQDWPPLSLPESALLQVGARPAVEAGAGGAGVQVALAARAGEPLRRGARAREPAFFREEEADLVFRETAAAAAAPAAVQAGVVCAGAGRRRGQVAALELGLVESRQAGV